MLHRSPIISVPRDERRRAEYENGWKIRHHAGQHDGDRHGATFTLSGLGLDPFDLENNISAIAFNYGTDLNVIPAPPAALLGVLGLALVGWIPRRAS